MAKDNAKPAKEEVKEEAVAPEASAEQPEKAPKESKPAKEEVKEEAVAPEASAEQPEKAPKESKPAKEKKSEAPMTGISSQGAAIFAPGRHPKERQIADKAAAEEGSAGVSNSVEDSNS